MRQKAAAVYHLTKTIGRDLLSHSYLLADASGMDTFGKEPDQTNPAMWQLGILKLKDNAPAHFIGNLHCRHVDAFASARSEDWIMLVYGDPYFNEMKKLAKRLSATYKITITVRLSDHRIRTEVSTAER
jgi:hypothetical protein